MHLLIGQARCAMGHDDIGQRAGVYVVQPRCKINMAHRQLGIGQCHEVLKQVALVRGVHRHVHRTEVVETEPGQ